MKFYKIGSNEKRSCSEAIKGWKK